MRPEFVPCPHDDTKIAEYREALTKVGIAIVTTAEALDSACRHVTGEHACVTSDVIAAYPQVVNMIAHGGFEDSSGRVMLVLPPDREAFRIVRDAISDSHTSIVGLAPNYIEFDLMRAIEETADRLGMPLGSRSTLTLPKWYTIVPSCGKRLPRALERVVFKPDGSIDETIVGKGHFSQGLSTKFEHAVIDIPDPATIGLPGPCFLDAYLSPKASVAEIKPGLARVDADRCWMDQKPHKHVWKKFWAFVPDHSERGYCALLKGERCVEEIRYVATGKRTAKGAEKGACGATRNVKVLNKSRAVLEPRPPKGWKLYAGLKPERDHVHLWNEEDVRWPGSKFFDIDFYFCPLCGAEAWPNDAKPSASVYRWAYGPAVDKIVKSMKFPKELRSAFTSGGDHFGVREGGREISERIQKLVDKIEREFLKEIRAFNEAVGKVKNRWSAKTPLSVLLDVSEQVAKEHGRRWKAPGWVLAEERGHVDDEEDDEDS